jgi:hypothetical protein
LALKERLADDIGVFPSQQHLVYSGRVLLDEMSLDFYKIRSGSVIYYLPVIQRDFVGQQPLHLLTDLMHLLKELPDADSRRFTDLIVEIRSILANSTLQASARIDPHTKQILLDAEETISTAQRPISRRTRASHARGQDLVLDSYDSSPDGFRTLQSMLEPDPEPIDDANRTKTRFRKRIGNHPLPNPWVESRNNRYSVFHSSGLRISFRPSIGTPTAARSPIARSRFSKQVAVLKNMGFDDETDILEALAEANGNVQLAAKLLQNHEPCK